MISTATREDQSSATPRLTRGLGLFSVGLGAAEVAAPGMVARLIGFDDSPGTRRAVRMTGARELMQGAGLLRRKRPAGWAWSRVAGDLVELAALGNAVRRGQNGRRWRRVAATAAVAGMTGVDIFTAVRGPDGAASRPSRVRAAVTVNRPPVEVYDFWRDFENLPQFMNHVENVEITGARSSRWTVRGPGRRRIGWDAQIVADRRGELIAWRSVGQPAVPNAGTVRFETAPDGQGTEVRVELEYGAPFGAAGRAVARIAGEHPDQQVRDDLRRLKQVLETGEVIRSDATPEGTRARRRMGQTPARPQERQVR